MGHPLLPREEQKETESEGFFAPAPQRMRLRLARERCSHWGHALRTPFALRMTANAFRKDNHHSCDPSEKFFAPLRMTANALARACAAVIIARRAGRGNANSKARAACRIVHRNCRSRAPA